ncbi:pyridoxamine 5'-phosphate oxidase family protein [Streptomyces sp900116325]|uniref:pyridoxamine 5'-phosphate oxidase family protein n=1 Tax=Streptomyces sp. 900116325 TaxID=3154295 RepID=UPI00332158D2
MTGAPPRGLEERLRDTRAKLESDVDLWVATSGSPGGVHLIPLSYLWDGTAFLVSTPRASVTGRNLLAEGRVRLSLGPTRDVVVIDGTAEPVDIADLGPEAGNAFASRTGFDPRARRALPVRATAAGSTDRPTGTLPPHLARGG